MQAGSEWNLILLKQGNTKYKLVFLLFFHAIEFVNNFSMQ